MNKIALIILLLFQSFIVLSQFGQEKAILFEDPEQIYSLGNRCYILKDKSGSASVEAIALSNHFEKCQQEVPNLGSTGEVYWLRLEVKNLSREENLLLEIGDPNAELLEFYRKDENKWVREFKGGRQFPFSKRKYDHQNYMVDLLLPQGASTQILIRVQSKQELLLPLNLGTPKGLFEEALKKDIIFGIYFGIILVMLLYNLFIYFKVKEKSYLYYVIFIFSAGMIQACFQGYAYKYLWPNSSFLANHGLLLAVTSATLFSSLFVKLFLRMKEYTPKLIKGLYFFIALFICAIILSFSGQESLAFNLSNTLALSFSLYLLLIGIIISRKKFRPARFFLIAWSIFLTGVVIFSLRNFGLLPHNYFTTYMLQFGSAIEVVLLSLALADRINELKKQKSELILNTIIQTQEEERKRFSRDLHDGIKQQLIGLKYLIEALGVESSKTGLKKIQDSCTQQFKQTFAELNNICSALMPEKLLNRKLPDTLKAYYEQLPQKDLPQFEITSANPYPEFSEEQKIGLYRVFQEFINNSLRYAKAEKIRVEFDENPTHFLIQLKDDGRGFDPKALARGNGFGLNNVKYRIEHLAGKVEIFSKPEEGTSYRIRIPK